MASDTILVTGGVKSGKSAWALRQGEEPALRRAFIATATAMDDEMAKKIKAHQDERKDRWTTFEEPRFLARQLRQITPDFDIIIVDCLTLWVSNLMTIYQLPEVEIPQEFGYLIDALKNSPTRVILVTNEVTMGILPPDPISRSYQNLLGLLNQNVAAVADQVYFMVSGIAQKLK